MRKVLQCCLVLVGCCPAMSYGQDLGTMRIMLSARRCAFSRLMLEARARPGPDIDSPERFEQLIADTDARLAALGLKRLSCQVRSVKIAVGCLSSVHGAINVPIACFEPGTRLRDIAAADDELALPPPTPAPTNAGMVCAPRPAPLTGEECKYVGAK